MPLSAEEAKRRRGAFRVMGYLGLLSLVGFVMAVRSARAEVSTMSLELGRDMAPLGDLLKERARVNLNGEHMWASSALTDDAVPAVLGRYERNCRENGVNGDTWGDVSATEKRAPGASLNPAEPSKANLDFGVFRSERGEEGAVLCFAKNGGGGFFERVRAFSATNDLGELGKLRYVYVRKDHGKTHVLSMWSDDHLRMDRLAGTDSDEPGFDNPDLPRPIRAKRTVSTSIDGTPYGALGYLSQAKPVEVVTAYTAEMEKRGWKTTKTLDEKIVGYMKDGSLVTLAADESKEGTVVGIGQMGVDPQVMPAHAVVRDTIIE